MQAVQQKQTRITVQSPRSPEDRLVGDGEELFLIRDFTAGRADGAIKIEPPDPGEGWIAEDPRSGFAGDTVPWPRNRIYQRWIRAKQRRGYRRTMLALLTMAHRKAPSGTLENVGPMGSKVVLFEDKEAAYTVAQPIGPRQPISETTDDSGQPNPIRDGVAGNWLGFHPGVLKPQELWRRFVRAMDRGTAAWTDPRLLDMLEGGMTKVCRFSLQARFNPAMSILPNGQRSEVSDVLWGNPMFPWLGPCGNAGWNGAHLMRFTKSAKQLRRDHEGDVLGKIGGEALLAIARDATYQWQHVKAQPGWDGDTTFRFPDNVAPNGMAFHDGAYMNDEPLAYRPRGPLGPDGARDFGECFDAMAWAAMDYRSEFEQILFEMLEWAEASILPSGFMQAIGYKSTGGPRPFDCGVLVHELSAAEIEAAIAAVAIVEAACIVYGRDDVPAWVRAMLGRLVRIYFRFWPVGTPPAWRKYFIVGERVDGDSRRWLDEEHVRMAPAGEGSTTNAWALFEAALLYGDDATRNLVRSRKGEFLDLWDKRADIRPWAAGLMGALA
jgi:hypothetical protein